MRCPGCGWEQPLSESCVVCGVRLTERRMTAAEARRDAMRKTFEGDGASGPRGIRALRFKLNLKELLPAPISLPLMAVRALVGAGALALGLYVLVFQSGVMLTPLATVVVLAYSFVGLYWILTSIVSVSLRQFLLEMVAFLVVTVGLRVDLPEAFDAGQAGKRGAAASKLKQKGSKTGPADGKATAEVPGVPDAEVAEFRTQMGALVDDGSTLLDGGVETQFWMAWKEQGALVRKLHAGLDKASQEAAGPVMRKLASLERAMESAVGGGAQESVARAKEALETLRGDSFLK